MIMICSKKNFNRFVKFIMNNEIVINTICCSSANALSKTEHRFKCMQRLRGGRYSIIPEFGDKSGVKETVLIEFRQMPHLEFLLRNTILRLPSWNHTVVCGTHNYDMVVEMCRRIDGNTRATINIIRLNIDNLSSNMEYSRLLLKVDFWTKFKGEKLLIYQEDSVLFHGNISRFMKYDYIGSPINTTVGKLVCNGGFSLRSKSKLILCLETVSPKKIRLDEHWEKRLKNSYWQGEVPEDVFFSTAMSNYGIGLGPTLADAREFAQGELVSDDPVGGHQFWAAEPANIKFPFP